MPAVNSWPSCTTAACSILKRNPLNISSKKKVFSFIPHTFRALSRRNHSNKNGRGRLEQCTSSQSTHEHQSTIENWFLELKEKESVSPSKYWLHYQPQEWSSLFWMRYLKTTRKRAKEKKKKNRERKDLDSRSQGRRGIDCVQRTNHNRHQSHLEASLGEQSPWLKHQKTPSIKQGIKADAPKHSRSCTCWMCRSSKRYLRRTQRLGYQMPTREPSRCTHCRWSYCGQKNDQRQKRECEWGGMNLLHVHAYDSMSHVPWEGPEQRLGHSGATR